MNLDERIAELFGQYEVNHKDPKNSKNVAVMTKQLIRDVLKEVKPERDTDPDPENTVTRAYNLAISHMENRIKGLGL
jgi:hypothetical protein